MIDLRILVKYALLAVSIGFAATVYAEIGAESTSTENEQSNAQEVGADKEAKSIEKDAKQDPEQVFEKARLAMSRQDVKNALLLLRRAAWQNYVPAQIMLGEYLDASELDEEALGWFMTAAYQGNNAGAFYLGKMYASGEGVEQNEEKAFFWIRFSAERNYLAAVRVMSETYKKGLMGQQKNEEQAKFWSDKIPGLEEAQKREALRQKQLARKAAEEKKKEDEAYLEKLKQEYLEQQEQQSQGDVGGKSN